MASPHFFGSIYLVPKTIPNIFLDFQVFHSLTKLKITQPISQKVMRQKFEEEKNRCLKSLSNRGDGNSLCLFFLRYLNNFEKL